MVALSIVTAQLRAAPECPRRELSITVRLHDYEHLPGESLTRASEIVTRLYEKIGVRIEWLGALRPDTRRARAVSDPEAPRVPLAELTVNILTTKMAARGRIPDGILGYAAVPPEGGMGRIAYVIYDRVRQTARGGPVKEVDLLGFVIAHETGHLLLGRGSRSETGLMQCYWEHGKIQRLDARAVGFSELQAGQIRETLRNGPAMAAAIAAGDSKPADGCVTLSHADQDKPE
jgi:hypothetical protein